VAQTVEHIKSHEHCQCQVGYIELRKFNFLIVRIATPAEVVGNASQRGKSSLQSKDEKM
jgi:hypothetical protein